MSWKDKFPKQNIFYQEDSGILYHGDCFEIMSLFPDNSIDTIITDPPYNLGFMGKKWDTIENYQEWTRKWAKEALRVAKPGATLLSFGGTRTWHRMTCGIEDAGWIIKDTLMWLYSVGFPKSLNIGKAVDKKLGNKRKPFLRTDGKATNSGSNIYNMNRINDNSMKKVFIDTKGNTEWEGYGTALKPAWEPIIMAMKPLDGTYADNALKWGVAGLNIDGARIPFEDTPNPATNPKYRKEAGYKMPTRGQKSRGAVNFTSSKNEVNTIGRFPANLLLDEEAAKMLDEQSGKTSRGHWPKSKISGYGKFGGGKQEYVGKGEYAKDVGGASRFFYVAKASRKERDMGLEGMPERKVNDGRKTPIDNPYQRGETPRRNTHPTVKPLKLMEYLCILTKTPTGGIVLDPFVGSGTTCMAAKLTGRFYIGIEKEKEYCEIARERIKNIQFQPSLL